MSFHRIIAVLMLSGAVLGLLPQQAAAADRDHGMIGGRVGQQIDHGRQGGSYNGGSVTHYDRGYDRDHRYQSRYPDRTVYEVQPRIVTRYLPRPMPRPVYVVRQPTYYQQRYVVGRPVVVVNPVPRDVLVHLDPAPRGYFYCMGDADNNVYLVSAATNIIVQVIALAGY